MVYGDEKNDKEIKTLAVEVFRHFTREALQFFYTFSLPVQHVDTAVELAGREHLDSVLAVGKGCIAVTGHYGNWEIAARKLAICGYRVNVIARDSDDPGMTGIATHIRESGGYKVFDRDQPIIGAYRALKNNEILAILPDQNDYSGIAVEFFGRPALTATGPAVLSIKSGAPIVVAFCEALGSGKYRLAIQPAIEFCPSGDEQADVFRLTQLVNNAIEQGIRRNPSQWLWLHERWKVSTEVGDAAQ